MRRVKRAGLVWLLLGILGACSLAPQQATVVPATPEPMATPTIATNGEPTISEIGSLKLNPPVGGGIHADLAVDSNNKLVFMGQGHGSCANHGVTIIDVNDPTQPGKLSVTPSLKNTSTEDVQVLRIGNRQVLATGLQSCGYDDDKPLGTNGLQLLDVSDPYQPTVLSVFPTDGGVHELDITTTPDGRVLALLAAATTAAYTKPTLTPAEAASLWIVDISDPIQPTLLGRWGLLDEPSWTLERFNAAKRGATPVTIIHSVRANADGTRAYASYWDAGVAILDISQPAEPTLLGLTPFAPGDEGDAHSVADNPAGTLLIQADEDFNPFQIELSSSAFDQTYAAQGIRLAGDINDLPQRTLQGQIVNVGRGCEGAAINANVANQIALIERGGCSIVEKLAVAQHNQASGAILYAAATQADGADEPGRSTFKLANGTEVKITLPAVVIEREPGLALAQAPAASTVTVVARFDGGGGIRVFDIADPAQPRQLSSFSTPNARNEQKPAAVTTAHNPELSGDLLFVSWYQDGVRAIDLSNPNQPREVATWPADDTKAVIWSVVPDGDLLFASDMYYGLRVLRFER